MRISDWSSDVCSSDLGQEGAQLAVGGQHGVDQAGLARGGFLRDLADPGGARLGDAAAVGVQLAGNQLPEGGLAGAGAADQADPLALVNRAGGAVDERVALNHEFEVVEVGRAAWRDRVVKTRWRWW